MCTFLMNFITSAVVLWERWAFPFNLFQHICTPRYILTLALLQKGRGNQKWKWTLTCVTDQRNRIIPLFCHCLILKKYRGEERLRKDEAVVVWGLYYVLSCFPYILTYNSHTLNIINIICYILTYSKHEPQ